VGDLFPHICKDFKEKSSIPRGSAAGIFYSLEGLISRPSGWKEFIFYKINEI
jgi:hypothetical protein